MTASLRESISTEELEHFEIVEAWTDSGLWAETLQEATPSWGTLRMQLTELKERGAPRAVLEALTAYHSELSLEGL
jgi:hypothetical protein